MSAIAEKRPWLMASRDYFFGLFRVKAWDYWWGYTAAQLELMVVDAPLVVYDTDKKSKKKRKPSALQIARSEKRFLEEHGDGKGGAFSIAGFMNKKKK